ncbi:S-adenosyl-L-methionine-dependent methyltransferase [Cladochytrium replicatum]|nr:S-adenosyl-L-methionine-dependent methyltransferase [Cladochytrium replicatum]
MSLDTDVAASWKASSADHDNGRTFHTEKKAPYILPADILEGSRLNLQHHLFRELFGGPNFAGVTEEHLQKGLRVLDIGCGTGVWLAEMHREFPNGTYHGMDITTTPWEETPKGTFENQITVLKANVLEKLPFEDGTFDYVHQQMLFSGIPAEKWPHVLSEIARVLKPGGVADLVEMCGPFLSKEPQTPSEREMWKIIAGFLSARGVDMKITNNLATMVQDETRFESVKELRKEVPVGWNGTLGEMWKENHKMVFMGFKPIATAALGISAEDWEAKVEAYYEAAGTSKTYMDLTRVTSHKRGG